MTYTPSSSKREIITLGTIAALFFTVASCAIPLKGFAADKALHIGILSSGAWDVRSGLEQELLKGLREQGYVEGKNLVIERRYAGANMISKAPEFARELAGMKLDAIVTTCTPSTRVAKEATSTTPIVMAAVSDPVGQKIISSLAKPGQNVTGLSSQAEELLPKRLEFMSALLPKTAVIAVLMNGRNPVHELGWQKLEGAAQQLKIKLMKIEVRTPDQIAAGMETAARARRRIVPFA